MNRQQAIALWVAAANLALVFAFPPLSVSDMQEPSRKFNDMAAEFHGRYDGWAAAHNKRPE